MRKLVLIVLMMLFSVATFCLFSVAWSINEQLYTLYQLNPFECWHLVELVLLNIVIFIVFGMFWLLLLLCIVRAFLNIMH